MLTLMNTHNRADECQLRLLSLEAFVFFTSMKKNVTGAGLFSVSPLFHFTELNPTWLSTCRKYWSDLSLINRFNHSYVLAPINLLSSLSAMISSQLYGNLFVRITVTNSHTLTFSACEQ